MHGAPAQEDPTLVHEHFQQKQNKTKRRGNFDKAWAMPNGLVEFMCHLPRTAMALPIKPLRWIIRQATIFMKDRESVLINSPRAFFCARGTQY